MIKVILRVVMFAMILIMQANAEKIYATFDVLPYQEAKLAFSAGGTVDSIETDISMIVKSGDTLAVLSNDDLRAKLKIANLAMDHAKRDYDRQLMAKDIIQRSKLELYRYKYENAKAEVEYIRSLLDKTVLKAPFDGIISARYIEVGDVVSGMAPKTAFVLQSRRKRKLILKFDQKYWNKIKTGDLFEYTIDGDPKTHRNIIGKIHPKSDSKSRKMSAEVYANDFIPGLFGSGYIIIDDKGAE